MRRQHIALLTAGLLLVGVASVAARPEMGQGSEPAVAEAVLTTDVVDRQPIDSLATAGPDVARVYLWTRIVGVDGEAEIEHVWYRGDEEMARIPLRVAGPNWRTWSSKNIEPSWTGAWRVDIVGPDGTVLDSVEFDRS